MSRRISLSRRNAGSTQSIDPRAIGYLDEIDQFLQTQASDVEEGQILDEESEQVLRDRALRSIERNQSPQPSERSSTTSSYNRYTYLRRSRSVQDHEAGQQRARSRSPIRRSTRVQEQRSKSTDRNVASQGASKATQNSPKLSNASATLPSLSIAKEFTEILAEWMTKGVSTNESKSIQESFKLDFENDSFSLNPPAVDEWVVRRMKSKTARKAVESAEKTWLTVQFKIMDIASPLLYLHRSLVEEHEDPEGPIMKATEAALFQWARAFHHVSRRRRHNMIASAAPSSEHLLEMSEAFNSVETVKHLFGQTFFDSMVKAASQELTLNEMEATSDQTGNHSRGGSSSRRGSRGRGGRSSRGGRGRRSRGNGNDSGYLFFPNFSPIKSHSAIGGRLKYFFANWQLVSNDSWVLRSVLNGVAIDFLSFPSQKSLPSAVRMSIDMEKVCDKEVKDLLEKGAIFEVEDNSPGFVSSLFVIPKKSGGYRPIVNLKPLNAYVAYEHFKMENLETVKNLVRKNDWLAKLDLRDAYLTVPVLPSHQKFLRFSWKGKTFQFVCLAFGLSSAPRIFTKLMKAVVSFLRERGIRLVIYLDDILFFERRKRKFRKGCKNGRLPFRRVRF